MNFIYNFVLELLNIVPSWSESTIMGIFWTLMYFAGFLILSIVLYLILRAIAKSKKSFIPKLTLSLTFTITSFLAFLTSTVFFILFWYWFNWDYFDSRIPELPLYLIPFAFFFLLTLSFFLWFLFERRKKSSSKIPSSVEI